jgi:hypothetical protein
MSDDRSHLEALRLLLTAFPSAKVVAEATRPSDTTAGPCARCGTRIERYGDRGRPLCDDCADAAGITYKELD